MNFDKKYIIAIDQGTTSCRVILFDRNLKTVFTAQEEYSLILLREGWVEVDAVEIWKLQEKLLVHVLAQVNPQEIGAIGITNQRETAVVWNKKTGVPIYNGIVWQDQRTNELCQKLKTDKQFSLDVQEITGLVLDPYFSATKVKWLLEHTAIDQQEVLFGTIDTWLLWKMTQGKVHATDPSNASRTMLFDIKSLLWSDKLLKKFGIQKNILPQVLSSDSLFGFYEYSDVKIPIHAILGDQQAALFGQNCFAPGMVKNTYGTGCFMLMNTGEKPVKSTSGMLTTIAWTIGDKTTYALEGSIFVAGAAIQWLRDNLEFFEKTSESETMANNSKVKGLYFVPAFSGLGAPFWDTKAQGAFFGITRQVTKDDLTRVTLESIGWRTCDIVFAMSKDAQIPLTKILVDGGASTNDFLMQFQSDMLGLDLERPRQIESTALGVAKLAGSKVDFWNLDDLQQMNRRVDRFSPKVSKEIRIKNYKQWLKAIKLTQMWTDE